MVRALEERNAAKDRGEKQRGMERFLSLVNQSGESSYMLLQNIYSPGRSQGLSLALALTKSFLKGGCPNTSAFGTASTDLAGQTLPGRSVNGACRVHGGGFAGTIQAYIPLERFPAYTEAMEKVFGRGSVTPLTIRPMGMAEIEL
jgi:galactokinase